MLTIEMTDLNPEHPKKYLSLRRLVLLEPFYSENILNPFRIKCLLFLVSFLFICYGTIGNYVKLHTTSPVVYITLPFGIFVIWIALWFLLAYSVVRFGTPLGEYGFTSNWGAMASLVVVSAFLIYHFLTGTLLYHPLSTNFLLKIIGATMEELVCRVLLINLFIELLADREHKVSLAILLSSVLFTIPHLPTKDVSMLIGLFTSSLIMGLIYYKTRSILIPAFLHTVANAGWSGGLIVTIGYVVISILGRFVLSKQLSYRRLE